MPARKTTDGRTPDGNWLDRWVESGRSASARSTATATATRSAIAGAGRSSFDREVAIELMLDDDVTLNAWMEDWWARHAIPNLEHQTRVNYERYGRSGSSRGSAPMSCAALTPRVVNTSSFRRCGARVRPSRRSGWRLRCCRASLRLAVTEERIASDPVGLVEKPSLARVAPHTRRASGEGC